MTAGHDPLERSAAALSSLHDRSPSASSGLSSPASVLPVLQSGHTTTWSRSSNASSLTHSPTPLPVGDVAQTLHMPGARSNRWSTRSRSSAYGRGADRTSTAVITLGWYGEEDSQTASAGRSGNVGGNEDVVEGFVGDVNNPGGAVLLRRDETRSAVRVRRWTRATHGSKPSQTAAAATGYSRTRSGVHRSTKGSRSSSAVNGPDGVQRLEAARRHRLNHADERGTRVAW